MVASFEGEDEKAQYASLAHLHYYRIYSKRRPTSSATVFCTSFRYLTKVANFKQSDSCAEFFDGNFNQLALLWGAQAVLQSPILQA